MTSIPTPDSKVKPVPGLEPDAIKGLTLVATPIGNLRDISLRALDTLHAADLILCEDTRVSGKLMATYGIDTPLKPYHDHNAAKVRPGLIKQMKDGARVALISDAGTPLISDPGYKLVAACAEENIAVTTVPGASAVLSALQLSALPTDRFLFCGFLPPKKAARETALQELSTVNATLVFYETGKRLAKTLEDISNILHDPIVSISREMTKKFEETRRGPASELAAAYETSPPKGEIVIVVSPPEKTVTSSTDIDDLLSLALGNLSTKDAAAEVARLTGAKKRDVYNQALNHHEQKTKSV